MVINSGEVWMIQLFDPSDEDCRTAAPLWESACIDGYLYKLLDKEWKHLARFGRINAIEDKKVHDFFPFRFQVYPSIVIYSPTGEYNLLPYSSSFEPDELEEALTDVLTPAVE